MQRRRPGLPDSGSQYYVDDEPHPKDTVPKDRTLADAIAAVVSRADAPPISLASPGFRSAKSRLVKGHAMRTSAEAASP